ncbi:uncharacterized protein EURHEDRAFT_414567 [Aspergillus ruber CBS 135680]|uniref:Uncharacterized protein n=1 Tax=Aspergillus ruber (strain CBS 135680) TaxID=1388766 RepID=A0A017S8Q8_ASPRC|nr:uncharacterized protein EURHEDRAFT_414567 [Aspergillus ruber CBS 135680]EYE93347.1 hypothetical protein EURHEDRAFT_414567 [Aspergillus ruber CBS 135680]
MRVLRACSVSSHVASELLAVSFCIFALQTFVLTGARIGAFILDAKHKSQRGFRYKPEPK